MFGCIAGRGAALAAKAGLQEPEKHNKQGWRKLLSNQKFQSQLIRRRGE